MTSSGHQRSTQDVDSIDDLISKLLLYHSQILNENRRVLNLFFAFGNSDLR